MLHNDGKISAAEMGILHGMLGVQPIRKINAIIFLALPAEACLARIAHRGRESERVIDLPYLKRIEICYDTFLTACAADGIRIIRLECGPYCSPEQLADRVELFLAEGSFLPDESSQTAVVNASAP